MARGGNKQRQRFYRSLRKQVMTQMDVGHSLESALHNVAVANGLDNSQVFELEDKVVMYDLS